MPGLAPRAWAAVVLAGWLAGGAASSPLAAGEAGSAPARPKVHRVVIEGFRFLPAKLEIRPGEAVEWVNRDLVPHTATAKDGAWDSSNLPRGTVYRQLFTEAGDFEYFCAFHPAMRGRISVVAP